MGEYVYMRIIRCVLNRDVVQRLSASIVANSHTALTSLDLSRNSVEDRGRIFLNVVDGILT